MINRFHKTSPQSIIFHRQCDGLRYLYFLRKESHELPTFLLITMIIGILPRIAIFMTTRRSIFSDRQCPPNRFAVVLGAGIEKDGRPTRVLRERIETAVNLLRRANVSALVLTGGNKSIYANETESMRLYAAELGVQNESILIDPDGFRSFDSCVNLLPLRSNQITLVTQQFSCRIKNRYRHSFFTKSRSGKD